MTRERDIDDVLREWVDHGAERLPHHNLVAALADIETTTQRGARPALLEGLIMRIQPFAVPIGIAAALVLAVGAFALASRPPTVGPDASSAPSPTFNASTPGSAAPSDASLEPRTPNAVTLELGGRATTLRANEDALWAAVGDDIVRIDPLTAEVSIAVQVPDLDSACSDCRPTRQWSFDVDATSAWIVYHRETQSLLRRFDLDTGSQIAEIALGTPGGGGSGADDVTVAFGSAWVVMCHSLTVARVDLVSEQQVSVISLGLPAGGACPQLAAIGASADAIWAGVSEPPGAGEGVVVQIDPISNEVVASIRTTAIPCGGFASDATTVWVSACPDSQDGALVTIDPARGEESVSVALGGLAGDPVVVDGVPWIPIVEADSAIGSGPGSLVAFDGQTALDAIRLGSDVNAHPKTAAVALIAFDAAWVTGDGGSLLSIPLDELGSAAD